MERLHRSAGGRLLSDRIWSSHFFHGPQEGRFQLRSCSFQCLMYMCHRTCWLRVQKTCKFVWWSDPACCDFTEPQERVVKIVSLSSSKTACYTCAGDECWMRLARKRCLSLGRTHMQCTHAEASVACRAWMIRRALGWSTCHCNRPVIVSWTQRPSGHAGRLASEASPPSQSVSITVIAHLLTMR